MDKFTSILRETPQEYYSYLFLFLLLSITVIKLVFPKDFSFILKNNIENQKSENVYLIGSLFTVLSIFLYSSIFFPFSRLNKVILFLNDSIHFGFILFIFTFYFILKKIFTSLLFNSLEEEKLLDSFYKKKYSFILYRFILLIFLFSLIFFNPFSLSLELQLQICILSVLFSYLIEWIFILFVDKFKVPLQWLYKILYLCTLEILPLMVVFKIIISGNF